MGKICKGDTRHKAGDNGRADAAAPCAPSGHSSSARGTTEFWAGERVEGAEGAGRGGRILRNPLSH